jgi:murein DD-endopeptidase MepM/ murein hydrolase activator NlpD
MLFLRVLLPRMRPMAQARLSKICLSAVLCLMTGLGALVLPAAAGPRDRLERIERRRAQISGRIDTLTERQSALSARINDLDSERARQESILMALEADLGRLNGRIEAKDRDLDAAQASLTVLSAELEDIQRDLDRRVEIFATRASAAYKAGPASYVEGLLSAASLTDLIDRYAYYESALDTDVRLAEEIQTLQTETDLHRDLVERKRDEIAKDKAALESDRAAVADMRRERVEARAALVDAIAQKRVVLRDVEADRAHFDEVDAQLAEDSDRIRDLLAAREAARRRRAAAAAAAAEDPGAAPTQVTAPAVVGGGRFAWPASGPVVSGFGYRIHPIFGTRRLHTGIDIGAAYGAPVMAGDDGVVAFAGVMSGYGNAIVVDHGDGLATTYNHLSSFSVGGAQQVSRGQVIGAVGCTGYCTGPHLHFEVRVGGNPVDPMPYLR